MRFETKVLIVTYYWPPAGGPGVQRWLKFAKYLKEFGITPVVVCPKNANYPILDPALDQEIQQDIEVLRVPIFEPARIINRWIPKKSKSISSGMVNTQNPSVLERILMSVRGHLFIPDARKFWVNPTVKYLKKYLEQDPEIKLVITTGPPHSVHLIGHKLRQSRAVKWLADFRDPWTEIYYHKALNLMGWAQRRHLSLEQKVLESADRILTTSEPTAASFQLRTHKPVSVITNGFDASDFEGLSDSELGSKDKFRITHVGTLMEPRNPMVLWQALANLIANQKALKGLESFAQDLEIELTGGIAPGVLGSIKNNGLEKQLVQWPNCSHEQAIKAMARGQLLLLSERNEADAHHIIPAKLFEYLALSIPIIALGPPNGAIQPILEESQAGVYFVQGDVEGVEEYLYKAYHAYKNSAPHTKQERSQLPYERKNLTQSLAALIKEMTL
jgi:glycosyltransferase involved in cell wall biosynthesis